MDVKSRGGTVFVFRVLRKRVEVMWRSAAKWNSEFPVSFPQDVDSAAVDWLETFP